MAESESSTAPTLNKKKLAEVLASRTGLARSVAYDAVETMFEAIAQTVAKGGVVAITNFGSFSRVDKQSRMARNPQTGDPISVPARKDPKFVAAPRLKSFTNSPNPGSATIRKNVPVAAGR